MSNFFRTFIPLYSDMSAPLTELFKDTKGGRQTLQWSMACQTAFVSLKTALTSAPVLWHFDPALRTAVHIDGSQNVVGAVLLQWQEDVEHPRPVAFMSRKLKGAQYRYDVRNVEALAAQVALQTWRLLSDFNFEEIKYVPGAHNVVPDFVSRPWDGTCDGYPSHPCIGCLYIPSST